MEMISIGSVDLADAQRIDASVGNDPRARCRLASTYNQAALITKAARRKAI
jgi:hypothetical protein